MNTFDWSVLHQIWAGKTVYNCPAVWWNLRTKPSSTIRPGEKHPYSWFGALPPESTCWWTSYLCIYVTRITNFTAADGRDEMRSTQLDMTHFRELKPRRIIFSNFLKPYFVYYYINYWNNYSNPMQISYILSIFSKYGYNPTMDISSSRLCGCSCVGVFQTSAGCGNFEKHSAFDETCGTHDDDTEHNARL